LTPYVNQLQRRLGPEMSRTLPAPLGEVFPPTGCVEHVFRLA